MIIGYWETDTSQMGKGGTYWKRYEKQTEKTKQIEYTDGEKIWFEDINTDSLS